MPTETLIPQSNPWLTDKPLFIQAPMEDVTDSVFRRVLAKCGGPDIYFTEFTNVEGLCSPGRDKIIHRLRFTDTEQPLIAQIWGKEPKNYYQVAGELRQMGFVGIDINMGCPERGIVKRGCCAGFINHPTEAAEVIAATKEGAGDLPVSVKTRCGASGWKTEEWLGHILDQDIVALTVHGRIAKEMSHFPARWDEIAKAVAMRNDKQLATKIIGNGDVSSYQDGLDKIANYGVDGVMIGRGIFSDPWIFSAKQTLADKNLAERMELARYHVELFDQIWGQTKNFNLLKKFFKIYVFGLPNATELRSRLMEATNATEAIRIIEVLSKSSD